MALPSTPAASSSSRLLPAGFSTARLAIRITGLEDEVRRLQAERGTLAKELEASRAACAEVNEELASARQMARQRDLKKEEEILKMQQQVSEWAAELLLCMPVTQPAVVVVACMFSSGRESVLGYHVDISTAYHSLISLLLVAFPRDSLVLLFSVFSECLIQSSAIDNLSSRRPENSSRDQPDVSSRDCC